MTAAIALQGLVKCYRRGEGRAPFVAVDGLSLTIPRGQIVALLGRQGAGKTTTLRLICGAIRPTSGRVLLNGHDMALDRTPALRQIGTVPSLGGDRQRKFLVRQMLARAGGEWGAARTTESWLAEFDIWQWRDLTVGQLSHGQRRLLALALALCGGSPILALDDPFAGLENRFAEIAGRWLSQMAREEGRTIVLASTRPDDTRSLCDRAIVLDRGTVVADVATEERRAACWHDDHIYRVRVGAHLGAQGAAWFADLTVTNAPDGTAVISGQLADQSALYGLLARIQNIGLPLLAIERGPPDPVSLALARGHQSAAIVQQL